MQWTAAGVTHAVLQIGDIGIHRVIVCVITVLLVSDQLYVFVQTELCEAFYVCYCSYISLFSDDWSCRFRAVLLLIHSL